ncbi:MAG: histidine--tRNA ligase [Desulfovibrio sp.]|jgi:histidyl-tRNA synthetase|nr:histidine--tRNA ligase [Desulfovibrio sp.]
MPHVTRVKGFADLFPPDSAVFAAMEDAARAVFSRFGFEEVRTPLLEFTELFTRSIGVETDVVRKEMYSFADSRGRSLSLRPEATSGVVRAYIDAGLNDGVGRLFTLGPMFRHERPQLGRMRQFHQINCECLGTDSPMADVEMILMLLAFLREIGLSGLKLKINSMGCAECRPQFRNALSEFLTKVDAGDICPDCARRAETNPLRVLDCKVPGCRVLTAEAPVITDMQCPACKDHFAEARAILEARSVDFELDHRLVRGLDYYCRTTFEVESVTIGAQSAVAGGGRYDGLVKSLGGPDVPGVGFACGMERLALLVQKPSPSVPDFFIVGTDVEAQKAAFNLAQYLRTATLRGVVSFSTGGMKSLMRQADKSGAKWCLIIGPEELAASAVTVKDMLVGRQITVPQNDIFSILLQPGIRQ